MLLLKNCRLVKELSGGISMEYADILIEEGKITAIKPVGEFQPQNCELVDMENKTVLPGFFDLHCHLMFVNQDWGGMLLRDAGQYYFDCYDFAKTYLEHGFTTLRDCGCQDNASLAVRDAINKGIVTGPRIFSAGRIITPTTKGNSSFGALYAEIDKVEDLARECRLQRAHGADFIKYMVTGAVTNDGGEPGAMITTPEEIEAIVKIAKDLDTCVAAHCHGTEGIRQAILAGVKTIEHASFLDQECIELILERGNVTSLVPTLTIAASLVNQLGLNSDQKIAAKAKDAVEAMKRSLKVAEDRGVCIGFGTDSDRETFMKYVGLEFTERKDAGCSNVEILRQATINSAQILGIDHITGSIEEGKYADLVVVDGKPEQDISVLCQKPVRVMKEGRWFLA